MTARLKSIRIQNYRSLADVSLELKPINVLFGPSGAGKSSLLDVLRLFHDCVQRGVEYATARRGHGIGLLYDGAEPGDPILLKVETERLEYELILSRSSGRIDPLFGERLYSVNPRTILFDRRSGTATAKILDTLTNRIKRIEIRDPDWLCLDGFHDPIRQDTDSLLMLLLKVDFYHSRSMKLETLKELGSRSGFEIALENDGHNLWSVLRILESRRQLDTRYETIMRYMVEAFPTFRGLVIEPTAPTVLYASFLEHGRKEPIPASGISDGHLQFLILLTALFSYEPKVAALVLFDEPEASLHPWALAVLGKAIHEATQSWGRQVILATHSPVLISQFEPDEQLTVEAKEGRTRITRVSEIEDIKDLLEEYATGSLYMSEAVAPQSGLVEPSASN